MRLHKIVNRRALVMLSGGAVEEASVRLCFRSCRPFALPFPPHIARFTTFDPLNDLEVRSKPTSTSREGCGVGNVGCDLEIITLPSI